MKKLLAFLLAFVMVAAMAVTAFAAEPAEEAEKAEETYTYTSTKVQGFSTYNANGGTIALENLSAQEKLYAVENKGVQHGNTSNRGRYYDAANYGIWKFDTKDAKTAKFIMTCYNNVALAVSTDNKTYTEVFSAGDTRLSQETRTFDLTQYIDGDEMYVKVYDSKPDDGWGTYIMAVGTYFVTTIEKTISVNDVESESVAFTERGDDGYAQYVISDFWSGITGSDPDAHPFYDRNIGDNKKFGGPAIVFGFPTNPNHDFGIANLRLNSNYKIEVSTDFENWDVMVEKDNTDKNGTGKYIDFSKYLGTTDMIYIKVHSPDDLDGNGPQIHTNGKIEWLSSKKVQEKIWDDLSTDANVYNRSVTHKLVYDPELNAVSAFRAADSGNFIVRYGNTGVNPIDVRDTQWFEFDVYVSNAFPKGYNNQFILELLDAQGSEDKHELQFTDFVINKGWTHVVLPMPWNYARGGSGVTGDIDYSQIQAFRLFSTTEEASAEYTFALKNLKFTNNLYVPNADWNMMTPNANTWVKESKNFTMDIGDANVVEVDVYSEVPTAIVKGYGIRLELTSAGKADAEEQEIVLSDYIYNAGWNHIVVKLNDAFKHDALNYVRTHAQLGSGNRFSLRNIKFTKSDFFDSLDTALIQTNAKLGNTTAPSKKADHIIPDLTGKKFIGMDLFVQDPQAFMNNGNYAVLELTSSGTCDAEEIQYTFAAEGTNTYPHSVDISSLTPGWNHIVLPIDQVAMISGDVKYDAINYVRIHVHAGDAKATAGSGYIAVKNIEGVDLTLDTAQYVPGEDEEDGVVLYTLAGMDVSDLIEGAPEAPAVAVVPLSDDDEAAVLAQFNADSNGAFDGWETMQFAAKVEVTYDADLLKIGEDGLTVIMPTMELGAAESIGVYTLVDGKYVKAEYENTEDGFVFSIKDFGEGLYFVQNIVGKKTGVEALDPESYSVEVSAEDEGLVVIVGTIDQTADEHKEETKTVLADLKKDIESTMTDEDLLNNDVTYSVVAAYDVSALKEGVEAQPNGTVTLTLPAPALLSSEVGVLYHVHDDVVEKLDYTVDDNGNWVVEMDSFSYLYVVKATVEVKGNPYTGDMTAAYIALALIAVIAAAGTVLYAKKRKA